MADGQAYQQPYDEQGGQDSGQGADTRPAAGRKKRAYAGQAYEFGTGANVAQAQQPPAAYAGQQPLQAYGAPAQPLQQQPAYAQPAYGQPAYGDYAAPAGGAQPAYGQPATGGQPGYQANDPYGGQGAVGGMTQQFGQMGIGGQEQPPQATGPAAPVQLNRLQTTDLISQPFHVSELDLPPPSIILPPNVGLPCHETTEISANSPISQASHHRRMQTALRSLYAPPSTLFQPLPRCSKNHACLSR